ncbi:hypothetical protein [Nocardia sp. NPDC004860]|uniref:hypothetical protein n=1 Tax=Nocardia sp. NPDC004860 TaxID=3154557 RepID=UPI0033B7DD11
MGMVPWFSLLPAAGLALALACIFRARRPAGPSVWEIQAELPHRAREIRPSVADAIDDAHEHRRCRPENCTRRCAALRVLYEAGRADLTDELYALLYERPESN